MVVVLNNEEFKHRITSYSVLSAMTGSWLAAILLGITPATMVNTLDSATKNTAYDIGSPAKAVAKKTFR